MELVPLKSRVVISSVMVLELGLRVQLFLLESRVEISVAVFELTLWPNFTKQV